MEISDIGNIINDLMSKIGIFFEQIDNADEMEEMLGDMLEEMMDSEDGREFIKDSIIEIFVSLYELNNASNATNEILDKFKKVKNAGGSINVNSDNENNESNEDVEGNKVLESGVKKSSFEADEIIKNLAKIPDFKDKYMIYYSGDSPIFTDTYSQAINKAKEIYGKSGKGYCIKKITDEVPVINGYIFPDEEQS